MTSTSMLQRGLRFMRRRGRTVRWAARRLTRRCVRIHIENRWRLGDEVLAIPFYGLVRERYPDADITVSVNYPELLRGCERITVDNARTEFDCDRFLCGKDDKRSTPRLKHLCDRHRIPFRPIDPVVLPPPSAVLPDPLPAGRPLVACSCGAGWVCKSFPVALMRELCEKLSGLAPGSGFVELGKDCPAANVGVRYLDRLSVADAAYVLAQSDLYIGPDSGLVHLAMAVGTPALVFYGPVNPARAFGPRKNLHAMLSPAECQGCWTDGRMQTPGVCPLGITGDMPEDYPCMRAFRSADAASEIARKLGPGVGTHRHVAACPEDAA